MGKPALAAAFIHFFNGEAARTIFKGDAPSARGLDNFENLAEASFLMVS